MSERDTEANIPIREYDERYNESIISQKLAGDFNALFKYIRFQITFRFHLLFCQSVT
jgi:hypothetical protein